MSNTLSYDDVVRTLDDLPSLPVVVMELLNSIDQDDVDISVLAKKVSHDQALTARRCAWPTRRCTACRSR